MVERGMLKEWSKYFSGMIDEEVLGGSVSLIQINNINYMDKMEEAEASKGETSDEVGLKEDEVG
jgi:hypothetical protein